ncbi:GNAT family N-acetyltransferase [Pedobacter frigoris]|uniref:GNAT family N-acetyltransferase n=1 Tax=Pedobacter frigoris TaxID=2571272 RepID=UPI00292CB6CB|nr:GNAT family N-acetyltransferase [Pedobacter frigoris]
MSTIQIEQIRDDLTWRIRHEAMYPDLPLEAVKLDDDAEGTHFGLYADDQLSSVISIFNEGTVYRFRKFATTVDAQGKGYGTALLKHIIEYVTCMGATMLWCNARVSATPFYEKFGFIKTNKTSRNHNIDFVIMELQLDN